MTGLGAFVETLAQEAHRELDGHSWLVIVSPKAAAGPLFDGDVNLNVYATLSDGEGKSAGDVVYAYKWVVWTIRQKGPDAFDDLIAEGIASIKENIEHGPLGPDEGSG